MVSAPFLIRLRARSTAFLPGQPPQLQNPTISIGSSTPSKAPFFLRHHFKIIGAWAVILCLHTTNNSYFHVKRPPF